MSRIGKRPIAIPDKVDIRVEGLFVSVKGPKGQLEYTFANGVNINKGDKEIVVSVTSPQHNNLWGLTRTLVNNMVIGVTEGFTKELIFTGVGYKAVVKGDTLILNLGYSHPIDYKLPAGITAKVQGNKISLHAQNKELLGFIAAKVRSFRPPEPYKGKGIKYADEIIVRKAGKTGAKAK